MASTVIWLKDEYLPAYPSENDFTTDIDIISSNLVEFVNSYVVGDAWFSHIYFNDNELTSYLDITVKPKLDADDYGGKDSIECLD